MSKRPEGRHVEHLMEALEVRTKRGDLKKLKEDLLDAERRALIPSRPHGLPAASLDPSTRGSTLTSDHDDGPVALTRTEATAVARIAYDEREHPDPMADAYREAVGHLDEAVRHLGACYARMDRIAQADSRVQVVVPCQVCHAARLKPDGSGRYEAAHHGSVGGRLLAPADLCDDCYGYTWRHDRLPTPAQRRHHDETGRWRIRQTA